MKIRRALLQIALLLLAARAAADSITIATVPGVPAAASFIAADKGYFQAAGLDVAIESFDIISKALPFLAQNRIQLAQGPVSAGYFNAIAEGLPVIMGFEAGSTPLYHRILLRPGLERIVKQPRDLIGRPVALPLPGSSAAYELGALLAAGGLRIASVEISYLGFQQIGAAMSRGVLDAALLAPPFTTIAVEQAIAVPWLDPEAAGYIKPLPMSNLAYLANTDWLQAHADAAERLFLALARASRDYCQAYHHGPGRAELIEILLRHKVAGERELIERMDWQARDPNGRINVASLVAIQHFFRAEGMIERESPPERLATAHYAEHAAQALGPFVVTNQASQLEGCR